MKKNIITIILLALNFFAKAQVQTNLIVSPTPPATLLNWNNNRENLLFIVSPALGFNAPYKIKTEIKLIDGTVIGKTDLTVSKTYTLSSATTLYTAVDVLEAMIFSGKYKTALDKTGKLPSDNYQICVQLVRPPDFVPFSEVKCKNFYLAATQLPILMKPYNEEELNIEQAKTAIIFRWTPLVPRPKDVVTYKLMVFEVLQNQNPVQAMRSNYPVLTKEVRGATQYIWQPQGIIDDCPWCGDVDGDGKQRKGWDGKVKDKVVEDSITNVNKKGWDGTIKGKQYVWTIQSFDALGNAIGEGSVNGDGVSEPTTFIIKTKHDTVKNPIQNIR